MENRRIKHPFGFEAKKPVANPFQHDDTFNIDLDFGDATIDLNTSPNVSQKPF